MIDVPDTLPRRERERQTRRAAMLRSALAVFAERGYEQATLEEVADHAEYGKGTLYNYFPGGKEEILLSLFEALFADLEAVITEHFRRAPDPPDAQALRDLIALLLRHFTSHPAVFLVIAKEAQRLILSDDPEKVALLIDLRDGLISVLAEPIGRAMEAGVLRKLAPVGVAHMMLGNVTGYLSAHLTCSHEDGIDGGLPDPEQAAAFIGDILFDGLLPRTD